MKGTIVYIGRFNLPDGSASAQRVITNKKLLEKLGYRVNFISTVKDNTNSENILNTNNINPIVERFSAKHIKNYLDDLQNVQYIILYNYHSIPSLGILKYARKNKIKVIGDITEWYGYGKGESFLIALYKFFDTNLRMRYINRKLDGLIVISEFLKSYYKSKKNLLILPNLIDEKNNKWKLIERPKILDDKKKIFTYVGNPGALFEKEDISTLVSTFSEVEGEEVLLKIIGINQKDYIKTYKTLFNNEPIIKNCIFYGKVDHPEALNHTYNSNFFIFLRPMTRANKAGFPTKFMEANYLNTPVITNDVGDISNYIYNSLNGELISGDGKCLKSELKKIILKSMSTNYEINHPFLFEDYIENTKYFLKGI